MENCCRREERKEYRRAETEKEKNQEREFGYLVLSSTGSNVTATVQTTKKSKNDDINHSPQKAHNLKATLILKNDDYLMKIT